ncbi:MAG: PepSY-associated TM helix domain-containing protein [Methylococcaceae bacterium]|nr:PepSY-associated TM helix domain-containing protein [Methylococcaceae bacterium]
MQNDLPPAYSHLSDKVGLKVKKSRLERLKFRRQLWLKVHLWLGLTAGAALVIIGLTGSIMVFWEELDEWLNQNVMRVEMPSTGSRAFRPMTEIEASVKAVLPPRAKSGVYNYPRHEQSVFIFWYSTPGKNTPDLATQNLFINPYTAQITGSRVFYSADSPLQHCFIGFIFKLHYALLLKDMGVVIVGILALLLLISILTGLIVWWPLTGKWAQAFTLKRHASVERFNFDLHKTSGVYTSLVLGAVLLSGVYLNLPNQFHWLVQQFSPKSRGPDSPSPQSTFIPNGIAIGLDKAMAIVDSAYPGGRWHTLKNPDDKQDVYSLTRIDVTELSPFWSERTVTLDQYSGNILEVRAPDTRRSAGEIFLDWQWPLHSGKAFGWSGRILVFLSGVACPVLFVTGMIRWLQKRRSKKLKISPSPSKS